jgi:hypothetical protein
MAWKVGMGYRFVKPTGHGTKRSRNGPLASTSSLAEDPDLHVPYLYLFKFIISNELTLIVTMPSRQTNYIYLLFTWIPRQAH